jgi:hypothetical protein
LQAPGKIGNWQPPKCLPGELLRPQVRVAFEELTKVAEAIALVQHSRSIRQRNSALNRASGTLNDPLSNYLTALILNARCSK